MSNFLTMWISWLDMMIMLDSHSCDPGFIPGRRTQQSSIYVYSGEIFFLLWVYVPSLQIWYTYLYFKDQRKFFDVRNGGTDFEFVGGHQSTTNKNKETIFFNRIITVIIISIINNVILAFVIIIIIPIISWIHWSCWPSIYPKLNWQTAGFSSQPAASTQTVLSPTSGAETAFFFS